MKKIRTIILQTEWTPQKTLETYSKMTPNRSGIWKNLVGVPTIKEANLAIIIDYTIYDIPKNMLKIYMGAHPPECPGYRCYDDKTAIAKFVLRDTFGFGEWWLDWNYDNLMSLKNPKKTKNLSCILSNKRQMAEHNRRRQLVAEFCESHPHLIDVYGRIIPDKNEQAILNSYKGVLGANTPDGAPNKNHWGGKTPALLPYRYSLEFDYYCKCENYFSERFFDSLLLWTMPIYSGGKGIQKFLPKNCYYSIDSWKTSPLEIIKIVNSNFREEHIKDIKEARWLLLNKLHLWARAYNALKNKGIV